MDFAAEFEKDFIARTLALIEQYDNCIMPRVPQEQQYETTLLINCLLGLLVLPHERSLQIPALPIEEMAEWGIDDSTIISWGRQRHSSGRNRSSENGSPVADAPECPHTLVELVHGLRNGIAHLNIEPQSKGGQVDSFRFRDRNGFEAVLRTSSLKEFVKHLAASV